MLNRLGTGGREAEDAAEGRTSEPECETSVDARLSDGATYGGGGELDR